MSTARPSLCCRRIREQISVSLDRELSRFERMMVDTHLAECADCRSYGTDVAAITRALRAADLQPLESPVVVPAGGRAVRLRLASSVAAVLAVALVGVASQIAAHRPPQAVHSRLGAQVRFPSQGELLREQALARSGSVRVGAALGWQTMR
jgi:predicted anti-sigma-YlaC factor YlaD